MNAMPTPAIIWLCVSGILLLLVVVMLVVRHRSLGAVHYAMSYYTHCGLLIQDYGGSRVMQHTTIQENVTCRSCLRRLNKNKYA